MLIYSGIAECQGRNREIFCGYLQSVTHTIHTLYTHYTHARTRTHARTHALYLVYFNQKWPVEGSVSTLVLWRQCGNIFQFWRWKSISWPNKPSKVRSIFALLNINKHLFITHYIQRLEMPVPMGVSSFFNVGDTLFCGGCGGPPPEIKKK